MIERASEARAAEGRIPRLLSAGIVAYNEEATLERSVRSLLEQRLPTESRWNDLTIVASGCTDRTVEVARRLAEGDPRVRVVAETERRGKAHALREVFARASGDALVLLNADARAEPDAVAALLALAAKVPPGRPYGVMGRPRPRPLGGGPTWRRAVETLWQLHHEYHERLATRGGGAHLSDELLLLSLPVVAPLPEGTVNDGSYLGVWLATHGGSVLYAPDAEVEVEAPSTMRDHLAQRRRIHAGNLEVADELGRAPSTLVGASVDDPRGFVRILGHDLRHRGARVASLGLLDALAWTLARFDRLPPARSYAVWPRIGRPTTAFPPPSIAGYGGVPSGGEDLVTERLARYAGLAGEFEIGERVGEILSLLPSEGPETEEELRRWSASHPLAGRLEGGEWVDAARRPRAASERRQRGVAYLEHARSTLLRRWGPLRSWVRFVGVSGSVAYGAPSEGDDLDLFVITRRGTLWAFLAAALLAERLAIRRAPGTTAPVPCLNHVLDERAARAEFGTPQGALFAREALAVKSLCGARYYVALLESAGWIGALYPRKYAQRRADPAPGEPAVDDRVPAAVRLANVLLFPLLAAYLQLAGLYRNHRFVRDGHPERVFRTRTAWSRHLLESVRFERIRALYEGSPVAGPVPSPAEIDRSGGSLRPSTPTLR